MGRMSPIAFRTILAVSKVTGPGRSTGALRVDIQFGWELALSGAVPEAGSLRPILVERFVAGRRASRPVRPLADRRGNGTDRAVAETDEHTALSAASGPRDRRKASRREEPLGTDDTERSSPGLVGTWPVCWRFTAKLDLDRAGLVGRGQRKERRDLVCRRRRRSKPSGVKAAKAGISGANMPTPHRL